MGSVSSVQCGGEDQSSDKDYIPSNDDEDCNGAPSLNECKAKKCKKPKEMKGLNKKKQRSGHYAPQFMLFFAIIFLVLKIDNALDSSYALHQYTLKCQINAPHLFIFFQPHRSY